VHQLKEGQGEQSGTRPSFQTAPPAFGLEIELGWWPGLEEEVGAQEVKVGLLQRP